MAILKLFKSRTESLTMNILFAYFDNFEYILHIFENFMCEIFKYTNNKTVEYDNGF